MKRAQISLARHKDACELPLSEERQDVECFVVSPQRMGPETLRKALRDCGLRPATLRELLCFAAQHPQLVPEHGRALAALGSPRGPDDSRYPVLWFWRTGRNRYEDLKLGWRVAVGGTFGRVSYLVTATGAPLSGDDYDHAAGDPATAERLNDLSEKGAAMPLFGASLLHFTSQVRELFAAPGPDQDSIDLRGSTLAAWDRLSTDEKLAVLRDLIEENDLELVELPESSKSRLVGRGTFDRGTYPPNMIYGVVEGIVCWHLRQDPDLRSEDTIRIEQARAAISS